MKPAGLSVAALGSVFFLSGAAAIVYQIVWQRTLLTLFGSSMESVTIVVTAFMLGLGVGSLAGGSLSRTREPRLPGIFAVLELLIGAYGLISLPLFRWTAGFAAESGTLGVGLAAGLLLLPPTLLMGATLPVLIAYAVRRSGQVGRSVSTLYALNTLGSALGALAAAGFVLGAFGQAGSLRAAAALNGAVALLVLAAGWRRGRSE